MTDAGEAGSPLRLAVEGKGIEGWVSRIHFMTLVLQEASWPDGKCGWPPLERASNGYWYMGGVATLKIRM
jgi:hypothetical protein